LPLYYYVVMFVRLSLTIKGYLLTYLLNVRVECFIRILIIICFGMNPVRGGGPIIDSII